MSQNNDKFNCLLKQWRDIEPKANFETSVWRRIRLAKTTEPTRVGLLELLRQQWRWKPAAVLALVMVASAILGSTAGLLTIPKTGNAALQEMEFLSPNTLAGGYLKVIRKDMR